MNTQNDMNHTRDASREDAVELFLRGYMISTTIDAIAAKFLQRLDAFQQHLPSRVGVTEREVWAGPSVTRYIILQRADIEHFCPVCMRAAGLDRVPTVATTMGGIYADDSVLHTFCAARVCAQLDSMDAESDALSAIAESGSY